MATGADNETHEGSTLSNQSFLHYYCAGCICMQSDVRKERVCVDGVRRSGLRPTVDVVGVDVLDGGAADVS